MWDKVKSVLGSIRFWVITLSATAAYIGVVETSGFVWSQLCDAIALWLGVVAGIGTIDAVIEKIKAFPAKKK